MKTQICEIKGKKKMAGSIIAHVIYVYIIQGHVPGLAQTSKST